MAGGGAEPMHMKGLDGARQARLWLDSTTRAEVLWSAYDWAPKVTIPRPDGKTKLFDLRGNFRPGSGIAGREFLVEAKYYEDNHTQGVKYREFLADCYCAEMYFGPEQLFEYMWFTWATFYSSKWDEVRTPAFVTQAVEDNKAVLKGAAVDPAICKGISERLMIIILDKRQEEHLTLAPEMVSLVVGHQKEKYLGQGYHP